MKGTWKMDNNPSPNAEHYQTWRDAFASELAHLDGSAQRLIYQLAWINGWVEYRNRIHLDRYFPLPRAKPNHGDWETQQ
jgi:hypothetical protein